MAYVVDCRKCGKPFKKLSNARRDELCKDCEPIGLKSRNRFNQDKVKLNRELTAQSRLLSRIEELELQLEEIRKTKEMSYDAVMIEMKMNMKEMIREIIEAYLFDTRKLIDDNEKKTREMIKSELKDIKFSGTNNLATINTRMKRHFDAIEHDIQRIFKKTKIKLGTSADREREKRYGRR